MPTALAIRHVAFEDLGLFAPVLEAHGFTIECVDATQLDRSAIERRDPELVFVLGGPLSVHDAQVFPLLKDERELLATRLQRDRPTIGICLGAQLMAEALGGSVSPMAGARKEIGFSPLTLTAAAAEGPMSALDDDVAVLHWHGEEFTLPSGVTLLASTPLCATQAFSYGANCLALQFHLEADMAQLERWYVGHIVELIGAGIRVSDLRDQAARHGARLAERAQQVLACWLDERGAR